MLLRACDSCRCPHAYYVVARLCRLVVHLMVGTMTMTMVMPLLLMMWRRRGEGRCCTLQTCCTKWLVAWTRYGLLPRYVRVAKMPGHYGFAPGTAATATAAAAAAAAASHQCEATVQRQIAALERSGMVRCFQTRLRLRLRLRLWLQLQLHGAR